jgi:hypothetical protein
VQVIIRMRTLYLHNLGALVRRRQQMAAVLQVRGHMGCLSKLRLCAVCLTPISCMSVQTSTLQPCVRHLSPGCPPATESFRMCFSARAAYHSLDVHPDSL